MAESCKTYMKLLQLSHIPIHEKDGQVTLKHDSQK